MNDQIIIDRPATEPVARDAAALLTEARKLRVVDVPTHAAAGEFLRGVAAREKAVATLFAEPKRAAHEAHKSIVAAEKSLLTPLADARRIVSCAMVAYEADQRRKAEEEARWLADEARRQAEIRALAEAEAAEKAGDRALADQILEEPVAVPPVHVAPAVAKTEGVSSRTTYRAEVTDLLALVRHVAANPEWIRVLEPAMPVLNGLARSQREALRLPGVRVVAEVGVSVRSA